MKNSKIHIRPMPKEPKEPPEPQVREPKEPVEPPEPKEPSLERMAKEKGMLVDKTFQDG